MARTASHLASLLFAVSVFMTSATSIRAEAEVDLALVLAVDVSWSMDSDEQALQRDGFIQAFRSMEVQDAVHKGMVGRIAVMYVEWAGADFQEIVIPWTVIERPADALTFAARLAQSHPSRSSYTSISGAIDFSVTQLRTSGVQALRQVIDISGDGPNNQGRTVTLARDEALAQGVTINGLPILLKEPDSVWDIKNLDLYFRDCVIGGPGAFMVPIRQRAQFVEAIRIKMIHEIAGHSEPRTLVLPTQVEAPANCLAGEREGRNSTGG